MLTESEQQDLDDYYVIAGNLTSGVIKPNGIEISIYGDDISKWPCDQIIHLNEKKRKLNDFGSMEASLLVKSGFYSKEEIRKMIK